MRTQLEESQDNPAVARLLRRFEGDEEGFQQWLMGTAEAMQGSIDERLRGTIYGGIQGMAVMQNRETLQEATRNAFRAQHEAELGEAMAPFGAGGPLREAVDAMIAGADRGGASLQEILGTMVGGQRAQDLAPVLQEKLSKFREEKQRLDDLMAEWEQASEDDKAEKAKAVEAQTDVLRETAQNIADNMERSGLRMDSAVDKGAIGRALRRQEWTRQRLQEAKEGKLNLDQYLDQQTSDDLRGAAGDLGMSPEDLMRRSQDELDVLLEDNDRVTPEQAARIQQAHREVATQMEQTLSREVEEAAGFAHDALNDPTTMRAGAEDLRTGIEQTLEAQKKLDALAAKAGGYWAASQDTETREEFAAHKENVRKGTEQIQRASARSGQGYLTEGQQSQLREITDILKDVPKLGIVEEVEVLALSEAQIDALVDEEILTAEQGEAVKTGQQIRGEEDAAAAKLRDDYTTSGTAIMGKALAAFTGKELATTEAIAREIDELGARGLLEDIQGTGPEARRKRAMLRERGEVVGVLREARKKVGMEGKSFEQMLYTDDGEARGLDWFMGKVSAEEYGAIVEAQSWKGKDKGWLDLEGRGPAGAGRTIDEIAADTGRVQPPVRGEAGEGGPMSFRAETMRLVINGKNVGSALLSGDNLERGDAETLNVGDTT
jgi:hypothetical protein